MKHSPYSEADSELIKKSPPSTARNIHHAYHVNSNAQIIHIYHLITPCLFNIHFDIILQFTCIPFPSILPIKIGYYLSPLPTYFICFSHLIVLHSIM
jgi:hypothetical protein